MKRRRQSENVNSSEASVGFCPAMSSAREARRKRLAERGADRLAFITGQLASLPADAPLPLSEPKSPRAQSPLTAPTSIVSTDHERTTNASVLPNFEPEIETIDCKLKHLVEEKTSPTPSVIPSEEHGTSVVKELAMETEAIRNRLNNPIDERTSLAPSSIIRAHVTSTEGSYLSKNFTSNGIIRAISATENIRLLCAAMLAVLVMTFGQTDYTSPSILKGIIASRPIYLLLLTDITLVVGFIILGGKGGEAVDAGSTKTVQGTGLVENLSKLLENALLVQKATNAAFMDCSVYLVVLISCVCLQQYWKWF